MAKKGENIFKRKDGRWEARYIHHYENGKAVYRYLYGKTYTEAKTKRRSALSFLENASISHSNEDILFESLANLWLENIKISVKESTYTRYHRIVHHYLVPLIKNQPLSNMDNAYLSCLTAKLLKEGGKQKRPLSAKTVSDILCVLKVIFRFGRQRNYPCPDTGGVKYPSNSVKNVKIMTEENRIQLEKFLMISDDPTSLGIFLPFLRELGLANYVESNGRILILQTPR